MVYIKKIIIRGFKSYKDQRQVEEFSPVSNVIVGRNGSGKSNFFDAIRFVLSDQFTSLRADERQTLLHESSDSTSVMSAYVEIYFDNSDNRFPIEKDEVVIRRQIGLKKDEYFLDRKHVNKNDIVNVLESAGFSRSNPYYIVQQGKVNALALMKDNERLELLKEVAGTRVYDERREKSVKIMEDTKTRLTKVVEVMSYIGERLQELEEEKEELKEYQVLDKERRSLEYAIHSAELATANARVEKLDQNRQRDASRAGEVRASAQNSHEKAKLAERELKDLQQDAEGRKAECQTFSQERQQLIKQRAKLELNIEAASDKNVAENARQGRLDSDIKRVNHQVKDAQTKLDNARRQFDEAVIAERGAKEQILDCDRRLKEIYSKQGRSGQFTSKKERDNWLRKEIKELEKTGKNEAAQKARAEKDIAALEKDLKKTTNDIERREHQLKDIQETLSKNVKSSIELKKGRDDASNRRKSAWKKDNQITGQIRKAQEGLNRGQRDLKSTVNKITASGNRAVRDIARRLNLSGVYGPLIELFECDPQLFTAVEVTAGNSLFHVVVDTDDTATVLLETLNQEKSGRVTFMPLNRLKPHIPPPPEEGDLAMPLIDQLRFKPLFKKALQQVFGRTLICRNIQIASEYARSYNLNCVTLDGDQVNKRGALTGGYYERKQSRLQAMDDIKRAKGELDGISDEATKIKQQAVQADQEVTAILGQMQKLETQTQQQRATVEQLRVDIRSNRTTEQAHREQIESKNSALADMVLSLKQVEEQIRALKLELGSDMVSQLTEGEAEELSRLNEQLAELQDQQTEATLTRAAAESQKNDLENLLNTNLLKRRDALVEEVDSLSLADEEAQLVQHRRDLEKINDQLQLAIQNQEAAEQAIELAKARVDELTTEVEEFRTQSTRQSRAIDAECKNMERLLNKRSLLIQKREDCMRKIRDLGSLPADAFEKYQGRHVKQLMQQLHQTKEELKKYSYVNKKALDQYVSFTEQRDDLQKRKEELDEGAEAIANLIAVLDQRKDEAIERTFKGVARYFAEVFSELVPVGKASLVMQRKRKAAEMDGESPEEGPGRIQTYSGVAMRVSFTGQGDVYNLHQLSGGQKSLVALALIFAIQRCDPAPFYLFDEIDSALDAAHRTAVAKLIEKQSKPSGDDESGIQFILTTFRPELVNISRKYYNIEYMNKVSTIKSVPKDTARRVIQEEHMDAQAP